MHLFEVVYLSATTIALLVCIPQMRQIIVAKHSDEFSLTTWGMWIFTQSISLMYVASLKQTILVIASALWTLFYICMVALIVYYRRPAPEALIPEEIPVE